MNHFPLVSIILSTYNGSRYIREAIESVLTQTYSNFELIIINDASNNEVENIILKYQKNDTRIFYVKNNSNIGLARSLNKGINIAQGNYIARIDDDDVWLSTKLEEQVDFMEKYINYGLSGTSIITINSKGVEVDRIQMRRDNNEIKNNILKSNQFTHSSVIIRKSILDKVGGYYDSKYNGAEDYDLWLKVGQYSKLHNLPGFFTKYRSLKTSISSKKWFSQEFLTLKIIIKNRNNYPKFYSSLFLRIGYFILRFLKVY